MVRLPKSKPTLGKVDDISETGIKFLYNGTLESGDVLPGVINLKLLVENPFKVEDFHFEMEILWKKPDQSSKFKYSYGAKFDFSRTEGLTEEEKNQVVGFLESKLEELRKDE